MHGGRDHAFDFIDNAVAKDKNVNCLIKWLWNIKIVSHLVLEPNPKIRLSRHIVSNLIRHKSSSFNLQRISMQTLRLVYNK